MNINILFNITDKPWGGGNQFLRCLKRFLVEKDVYSKLEDADVIIVNSKDNLDIASSAKKRGAKIIHRIDGLFSIHRKDAETDKKVYAFSKRYADAVVHQSDWARQKHRSNGLEKAKTERVIYNCADPKYFNTKNRTEHSGKIKLLSASWSTNHKKGFETYQIIDNNLNTDKYEYHFAGRTPTGFKNIIQHGELTSEELGRLMNDCDVFISAVEDDACSNTILEASACGCHCLTLNSGANSELSAITLGTIFDTDDELLDILTKANFDNKVWNTNLMSPQFLFEMSCGNYYELAKEL